MEGEGPPAQEERTVAIGMMTGDFDSKVWNGAPGPAHPNAMRVTYAGRVIETREMNGRDDSDFYALVWDDETESIVRVDYATTRGWTYPNWATVDADEATLVKVFAFRKAAAERVAAAIAAEEAKVPRKGRMVKVIKGRKVPIGTVAEVGWFGKDRYARIPRNRVFFDMYVPEEHRVGLRIDGEMVFTSAANVEVLINEEVSA